MLAITLYVIFAMLLTLWSDITRYIIPNWLVGSLLALYPVAVWLSPHPVDWQMALVGMGIVFAVGFAIFAMRWMGAGDIKLITVCALWVGFGHLLDFIVFTALVGGLLSAFLWGSRKVIPQVAGKLPFKKVPRILQVGEPVPYGIAIAAGFLLLLSMGRIPLLVIH